MPADGNTGFRGRFLLSRVSSAIWLQHMQQQGINNNCLCVIAASEDDNEAKSKDNGLCVLVESIALCSIIVASPNIRTHTGDIQFGGKSCGTRTRDRNERRKTFRTSNTVVG